MSRPGLPRCVNLVWVAAVCAVLVLVRLAMEPGFEAAASYSTKTSNQNDSWSAAASFATCQSVATADAATQTYPMAEASGTSATDTSGNSRTGTYLGTITHSAVGPCQGDSGKATTFDGSSAVLTTPNKITTPPNTFSIEIWFKVASGYSRGGGLMGFSDTQSGSASTWDRQIVMTNSGTVEFGIAGSSSDFYVVSPSTYNNGAWHDVVATLGSTGERLYIDGSLVVSNTSVTSSVNGNAGYWRMGNVQSQDAPNPPTSKFIAGSLAFASVYSTQLSLTRVSAHYAAGS